MTPINTYALNTSKGHSIDVSVFGEVDYQESYLAMSKFALERTPGQVDQIWLLQHSPIYTQGTACEINALLPSDIETIKTDRGGQITYHGPGQIVMYPLVNLRRHRLGVKRLVERIEQSMIDVLADLGIKSQRREDAPGVFVGDAKIGALGLRIRKGSSYHGLSLNVDMDLTPFSNIDPCGFQGLRVTQISDHADQVDLEQIGEALAASFVNSL